MEFCVFSQEKQIGHCTVQDDGLYWRIEARCRQERDIPMRLFGGGKMLGVPQREGEWWNLRRRLSKKAAGIFSEEDNKFYLLPAAAEDVVVYGFALRGYVEQNGRYKVVRMEFSKDTPHPCMPLFCFFNLRDGFWEMLLDEEGNPVLQR